MKRTQCNMPTSVLAGAGIRPYFSRLFDTLTDRKEHGMNTKQFQEVTDTTTVGYLQGPTPTGERVVVWHSKVGASGYRLYWRGRWFEKFRAKDLKETFGISPRYKCSGDQEGYTSQPSIMAIWQHLARRYNEQRGCGDVDFSKSDLTNL